jgi:hypothetical protein
MDHLVGFFVSDVFYRVKRSVPLARTDCLTIVFDVSDSVGPRREKKYDGTLSDDMGVSLVIVETDKSGLHGILSFPFSPMGTSNERDVELEASFASCLPNTTMTRFRCRCC